MSDSIYNIKLTDKDVYKILYLSKVKNLLPNQIAELFPVTKVTVKNIIHGKSRKDCYYSFMDYLEAEPVKVVTLFPELA